MDEKEKTPHEVHDVAQKIFLTFVEELRKSTISTKIIERLNKTIIVDGNFSEQALRIALLPDNDL